MTDQEFREQYQPLHVPAHFEADAPLTDHILFALGQLGEGTAADIIGKLKELGDKADRKLLDDNVQTQLKQWYEHGLLAAEDQNESTRYSLRKITTANDGAVNPDLLAPGLD